jgi:hypothetical protein
MISCKKPICIYGEYSHGHNAVKTQDQDILDTHDIQDKDKKTDPVLKSKIKIEIKIEGWICFDIHLSFQYTT